MRQAVIQKAEEKQRRQQPNLTGIPTQMKMDFEQRSGLSFDDVRVHYNSDRPARIGALAYTQIPEVYMGPGQERHLRHELGHVVQQKQGIVRPTIFLNGTPINDNPQMEKTADSVLEIPGAQRTGQSLSIIQCERPPTFFTYLATSSGNTLSGRQGPHTIPHIYYDVMLNRLTPAEIWSMIPSPNQIEHILQLEGVGFDQRWFESLIQAERLSRGMPAWDADQLKVRVEAARADFKNRIQRYLADYLHLYQQCLAAIHTPAPLRVAERKLLKEGLSALLNMHPYATYAWREAFPNHAEMVTKGESVLGVLGKKDEYSTPQKLLNLVDFGDPSRRPFNTMELQNFLFTRLQYGVRKSGVHALRKRIFGP